MSKVITKALALKMSKVMNVLIDPDQMEFVNGRSLTDNLCSILFMKDHCMEKEINGVLISLEVKKGVDSLSHQYTETIF